MDDMKKEKYQKFDKLFCKYYADMMYQFRKIRYQKGEKVRIVFLFQVASFWPSWESFYKECLNNSNVDVKFVFYDKLVGEKAQMLTAKKFLIENNIPYVRYKDFSFEEYRPHIVVYQTPYDDWHRERDAWSYKLKAKGCRIVYIPYGIEIADTERARADHFEQDVVINTWRLFTFSPIMKKDYLNNCINGKAVRAVGVPKFDAYFDKKAFELEPLLQSKISGRKICLWKVHFPKVTKENGKNVIITPYLKEYLEFARKIIEYNDIFFIFMPHPKFDEMAKKIPGGKAIIKEMYNIFNQAENVYIDTKDDYRSSLINADYIMIDRSALMVEAGVMGVPVLYLENKDYKEKVTRAIKPLVSSYYHGTGCKEMVDFIQLIRSGNDPKKEMREKALKCCFPKLDGKAGKRILHEILKSLKQECF